MTDYSFAEDYFDNPANWEEIVTPPERVYSEWKKISKYIDKKLWDPAKRYRTKFDRNWEKYHDFYRSKQWPSNKKPWQATLCINHTYATIDSIVSAMTDQKPKINLIPSDPTQGVYIETLNAIIDSIWRRRGVVHSIANAVRCSLIYGIGYLKAYWDPELEGGSGDINISSPNPWCIWVEEGASDFADSSFVIQAEVKKVSYVKRLYPEKAKYIRPGMGMSKYRKKLGQSEPEFYDTPGIESPVDDQVDILLGLDLGNNKNPDARKSLDNMDVLLVEAWFLDDETEEIVEQTEYIDADTHEVKSTNIIKEVAKYPYGRLVTKVGDIVLQDVPVPYKLNSWPFVKFIDNEDTEEDFFGFGEVELLEDIQKELNKRRSQMIDHANHMGNSAWVIDQESGVDPDQITNRPGIIITKKLGTQVHREPAPPFPEYILRGIEMSIRDIQTITGVSDVITGGVVPRGIRSGAGLSEAQDIAATRIRLKVRNMERSIEALGRIIIRLIQQYYTEPRIIAILGAGKDVQWISFDGTELKGDWDIVIGTGSTLPVSRTIRAEQALRLHQLGIIDNQAVLEAMDWPGREEIMRRNGMLPPEEPGDMIPRANVESPPPKTDNSRSRRTGRSVSADVQFQKAAQPGSSETFGQPPG